MDRTMNGTGFLALAGAFALLGIGCEQEAPQVSINDLNLAGDSGPQPDIIDRHGNRWQWVRKVTPIYRNVAQFEAEAGPIDAATVDSRGIDDETIESLAAKLRPRMLLAGHEYLLDHDPVELAMMIKWVRLFSAT